MQTFQSGCSIQHVILIEHDTLFEEYIAATKRKPFEKTQTKQNAGDTQLTRQRRNSQQEEHYQRWHP